MSSIDAMAECWAGSKRFPPQTSVRFFGYANELPDAITRPVTSDAADAELVVPEYNWTARLPRSIAAAFRSLSCARFADGSRSQTYGIHTTKKTTSSSPHPWSF